MIHFRFASSAILICTSIFSFSQTTIDEVVQDLSAHNYKAVVKRFTPSLKKKVPCKTVKALWVRNEKAYGSFQSYKDVTLLDDDGIKKQTAIIQYEKIAMKLSIAEDERGISSILISPQEYRQAEYAKSLVVAKDFITVKTDTFSMPGEIIMPRSGDRCPLVILVHGSGPNDMDENIGPNKVFYDLAMGLAAQGVATLRYHKRSKVYPDMLNDQFTLADETINDALSAARMIYNDTNYHFTEINVLGHSLGAYSAPQIADSLPWLEGAILFSANARRLEDLIEYQYNYLLGPEKERSAVEKVVVKQIVQKAEKIRTLDYDNTTPAKDLLAYWPGSFWTSVHTYDPVATVKNNTTTDFLILQGEKDYQITMVDFKIWKAETESKPNVNLKYYPGLTHLFTPSVSEKPGPTDYYTPGNVSLEVITDIANWIKQ